MVFFFVPLFSIPFTYAVLKYDLMDIRIVAKAAFIYGTAVAVLGGTIVLFNTLNQWIENTYTGFPFWIVPLVSSLVAVALGFIVWYKIRENEALKYEFVTIIAHKFRTPLTESKWATDELLHEENDQKKLANLRHIQESNEKLIGLTSALVDLANMDKISDSSFRSERVSLTETVREAVALFNSRFKEKNISFFDEYPSEDIMSLINQEGIRFVVQTLLENSLHYTPKGGRVSIVLSRFGRKAIIRVSDTGIGIKPEEMPRIFSIFYRTKEAQNYDTEGFGVGLSQARSIVNRLGGKIEVYSEGEGMGSTFTVILPII